MSSTARAALDRSGAGRVLHVFPIAVYIRTIAGDVFDLLLADRLGPLSIAVSGAAAEWEVAPGDRASWTRSRLTTPGFQVDLEPAVVCNAVPPWSSVSETLRTTKKPLSGLRRSLLQHAPPESMAELLRLPGRGTQESLPWHLRFAKPRAEDFGRALAGASARPFATADSLGPAAAGLAGLGTGFTPAGDDFLLGAMYAAYALLPPEIAAWLASFIAESACPRTTTVSAAFLRAAAGGAASEGWHLLVDGLSSARQPGVEEAVRRLCEIGHTSGADSLAGFLLSADDMLPERGRSPARAARELGLQLPE
jgi:hypothetical protein